QLLAVLQMDLAAGADLRLAEASGPALRPLPLPYPLD
ncbi:MAG: folate-binding protein, partial [Betaproteobacteria bacterium]|nr:folate-binding protein [Betaproteobacteria bacterium]